MSTAGSSKLEPYSIRIHQRRHGTVYLQSPIIKESVKLQYHSLQLPLYRLSEVISSLHVSYERVESGTQGSGQIYFPSPLTLQDKNDYGEMVQWKQELKNYLNKGIILLDNNKHTKAYGKLIAISQNDESATSCVVIQKEETNQIYVHSFDNYFPPPFILYDNSNTNDENNSNSEYVNASIITRTRANKGQLFVEYSFYAKPNQKLIFDFVYRLECFQNDGATDECNTQELLKCFVILSNPLPFQLDNVTIKLYCDEPRKLDYKYGHTYRKNGIDSDSDSDSESHVQQVTQDQDDFENEEVTVLKKRKNKWFSIYTFEKERRLNESGNYALKDSIIHLLPFKYTLLPNRSMKCFLYQLYLPVTFYRYYYYHVARPLKGKVNKSHASRSYFIKNDKSLSKYPIENGKLLLYWHKNGKIEESYMFSSIVGDISGTDLDHPRCAVKVSNCYESILSTKIDQISFICNQSPNKLLIKVNQSFERYIALNVWNRELKDAQLGLHYRLDIDALKDKSFDCEVLKYDMKRIKENGSKRIFSNNAYENSTLNYSSILIKSKERSLIILQHNFYKEKCSLLQNALTIGRIDELYANRMITGKQQRILYEILNNERDIMKFNRIIYNVERKKKKISKQIDRLCIKVSVNLGYHESIFELLESMENIVSNLNDKIEQYRNTIKESQDKESKLINELTDN